MRPETDERNEVVTSGVWGKVHSAMAAAQGISFVTLKAFSFGMLCAVLFAVGSVGFIALFLGLLDFFGISMAADFLPADFGG